MEFVPLMLRMQFIFKLTTWVSSRYFPTQTGLSFNIGVNRGADLCAHKDNEFIIFPVNTWRYLDVASTFFERYGRSDGRCVLTGLLLSLWLDPHALVNTLKNIANCKKTQTSTEKLTDTFIAPSGYDLRAIDVYH